MKKRYIVYTAFLVLTVGFINIKTDFFNKTKTKNETSVDEIFVKEPIKTNQSTELIQDENYLIKFDNGILNIYDWNRNIIGTIAVDSNTMRAYDKKMFEAGVVLKSIEDVKHITEDFSE